MTKNSLLLDSRQSLTPVFMAGLPVGLQVELHLP